ncbi:SRPBCC family protein [Actinomadura roseirufa]|uniref:SRPBCC family protein n=1 Tax=Actinomadura roseirufa TaxID=2094049 RepID=UPI001040E533|nr:SRPBCC family protein [Actinomadura roseirufa]
MTEVTGEINAVRRRVGERVLEAGAARTVTIARTYDAPVEDVWDACTDPERIPRWFLPISGDLRPGGRYQLEGNAGGTIQRCDPPRALDATWEFAGQVSWIELRLTAEPGGRTRFALEHVAHADDHWDEFGPGAVGIGWELGMLALSQYLPAGRLGRPRIGPEWPASDEGRAFIALSGERWRAAHAAAGVAEDVAASCAARTIAAYTGTVE